VKVTGLAGHAGTVPMNVRQDALTAASEMILFVEHYCRENENLVGTVGRIAAMPGAINVIPQDVEFSVDVRSGADSMRRSGIEMIRKQFDEIAKRRNVRVEANPYFELNAAPCDPALQKQFADAIAAQGIPVRHLPSGAGHDAMEFPQVCPIAMLFVRCGNGGMSHHPSETMTAEDADVATKALLHFFENYQPSSFAANHAQRVDRT
jgi:allantoate deiminase